jgi:hypothetical protein
MTVDATNDVLMGGGAPPRIDNILGQWVGGPIVAHGTHHVREYDAQRPGQGALRYFPSGDPIRGIHVDVQTDGRHSVDDDGVRRIWVEKQRLIAAVRQAVIDSRATGIETGGSLYVCWTGTEPSKSGADANTYAARYTPPGAETSLSTLGVSPVSRTTTHASAQPQAPTMPVLTEAVAAAMRNAGIDTSAYIIIP